MVTGGVGGDAVLCLWAWPGVKSILSRVLRAGRIIRRGFL